MARNSKNPLGKGLGALVSNAKTEQGVTEVDIERIDPNPYQPRTTFAEDALATLVESIRRYGLVQPIVVRKMNDRYQLVAGERRWRACQELGMHTIPALIKDYSTEETTEIALVENLQRQDLDPIEEAYAYSKLIETFKLTQEEIAVKLGRSRSHVANMLRLLKLPAFLKDALSVGDLTIGQARPLLALENEEKQQEALAIIQEKDLNSRQIEMLVKQLGKSSNNEKREKISESAEMRQFADRLKISLGAPVAIKMMGRKKNKGIIEISFASEEEFTRLMTYIEEKELVREEENNKSNSVKFSV